MGAMPLLVAPHLPAGTLRGAPQPEIAGPGVILRPWIEDDVATLVHAYADPGIQRWHCRSLDPAEAAGLVRRWTDAWTAEPGASWAVTEHAGGPVVGRHPDGWHDMHVHGRVRASAVVTAAGGGRG